MKATLKFNADLQARRLNHKINWWAENIGVCLTCGLVVVTQEHNPKVPFLRGRAIEIGCKERKLK